jgi:hypothetical protein
MSHRPPVSPSRPALLALGLCWAAMGVLGAGQARAATSCMVMGDPRAVVKTPEGPRSPMFLAQACEQLRLVSGKAMASWVGEDGKPHLMPITPQGPAATPSAGAEERSTRAVWAELASRREVQSPAVMRGVATRQPDRVYVPEAGLKLPAPAGALLTVTLQGAASSIALPAVRVGAEGQVTLSRQQLPADTRVLVSWILPATAREQAAQDEVTKEADAGPLWLHTLPLAEQAELDEARRQVRQQVGDPLQQTTLDSMLFEQRHLDVNLRQSLAVLSAVAAVNGSPLPRP